MQQKQINYKPDDETRTQAPIGNIVYEIDDDDSQNIYHSPDAIGDFDDDDGDGKLFAAAGKDDDIDIGRDGVERPKNDRRQQSNKYTDRIDGSKETDDDEQKQQLQRYDGDDVIARQRHHSSQAADSDKLIDRQMNHKNWGKRHVLI